MTTRDFAPISPDQSLQIRLASIWLILNAALTLGLIGFGLVAELSGSGEFAGVILNNPLGWLLMLFWGVAMFKAGRALGRKSILGGYAGLAIYGLPLLLSPLVGGPSLELLVISGLGIAAILSAWSYLEGEQDHFEISVAISAPAATVWAIMRDGRRWPEWTPSVTSIELLDPEPLAIGSRARIRQPRLPPALWTVTELTEGKGFTWVSGAPGIEVTACHGVEPSGNGTRATLSIAYAGVLGPLVAWMTRRINDRYLAMEAAGLKRRSELGEAPAPIPRVVD